MNKQKNLKLGIKLIIGFHILNAVMFIVGQGESVVAYDTVTEWGLVHDRRAYSDPFIIVLNKAIGLADVMVVPIFIVAAIGLWQKRFYGLMASFIVLGINFYWTLVAWIKQYYYIQANIKCEPFGLGVHSMLSFVFLFSVWASWYLYKNRRLFY